MTARALMLLIVLGWPLQALDEAIQQRVQAARRPGLEAPMHAVSNAGRPVLVAGALAALAAGVAGRALVGEVLVVLVPVNLAVEGLKYATHRTRPDGDTRRRNSSFPSSHAANAFAAAWVISRRWRPGAALLFALAATVAFSRIYLNRHWFVDVTTGALLGVVIPILVLRSWGAWRARTRPTPVA